MTQPVETPLVSLTTAAGQLTYTVTFTFADAAELRAELDGAAVTIAAANPAARTVTLADDPGDGKTLVVWRETEAEQLVQLRNTRVLPAGVLEAALDDVVRMVQEARRDLAHAVRVKYGASVPSIVASTSGRTDEVLRGDGSGGFTVEPLADMVTRLGISTGGGGGGGSSGPASEAVLIDGTAATPAVRFQNDTASGLYRPGAANRVSIAAGGIESVRFGPYEVDLDPTGAGRVLLPGNIEVTTNAITSPTTLRLSATQLLLDGHNSILGRDFVAAGGDPSGFNDNSPLLQQLVDQNVGIITFPPGVYRFDSKVTVPPGTALIGAGPWATRIVANMNDYWLELLRNTDPNAGMVNFCRSRVIGFEIVMTGGGIYANGHQVVIRDLHVRGGAQPFWAVRVRASNEAVVWKIHGGYNDTVAPAKLTANGVSFDAEDVDLTGSGGENERQINYGDSLIGDIRLAGEGAGWIGLRLAHESTNNGVGVINNVTVMGAQLQCPAPSGHPDAVPASDSGVYTYRDSVGLRLHRVQRCNFITVDTEATDIGVLMTGETLGGTAGALGATTCKYNSFINCQQFNSRYSVLDNNQADPLGSGYFIGPNEAMEGMVGRNTILASQMHAPVSHQPTGDTSANTQLKAGSADFFVPMGLWISTTMPGKPVVKLYAPPGTSNFPNDQLIVTTGGDLSGTKVGGDQLPDGHPQNKNPSRGLRFNVGGVNSCSISRTVGTDLEPGAYLQIGNGTDRNSPEGKWGPLKGVRILDPLALVPISETPAAPFDHSLVAVDDRNVLSTTSPWAGPGLYQLVNDATDGAPANRIWLPIRHRATPQRVVTGSQDLTRNDLNGVVIVNNANPVTLTIPANLLREDEVGANHVDPVTGKQTRSGAYVFVYRAGTGDVIFSAGAGTTLELPEDDTLDRIPAHRGLAMLHLTRTGAGTLTCRVTYFGATRPGVGRMRTIDDAVASPYTLTADDLPPNRLAVRVNRNTNALELRLPANAVPVGQDVLEFTLANHGTIPTLITGDTGMTVHFAGGSGGPYLRSGAVRVTLMAADAYIAGVTEA